MGGWNVAAAFQSVQERVRAAGSCELPLPTSGSHLRLESRIRAHDAWLVDGMSVFASLMYFEKTLSPADAQEHINKALVRALGYEGNASIRQAGNLEKDSPDYRSLVQYKGAYVLRMLRWVMGDDNFQKLLTHYLEKFQNTPASTEEFEKMASTSRRRRFELLLRSMAEFLGRAGIEHEYTVFRTKDGYKVVGQIRQDLDLFRMPVETADSDRWRPRIRSSGRHGRVERFRCPGAA